MLSMCCFVPMNHKIVTAEENTLGNKIIGTDIPDSNLREYLNTLATKLGYNALYSNIFKNETTLVLENRNFKTLEGLEKFNFENVTIVDFSDNQIETVPQKAFFSMKNLKTLDLSNNLIKNVSLELYAEDINLSNNTITNLYMKNNFVKSLNLSNNQIDDSDDIQIMTTKQPEEYSILAYNNLMAGKNSLTNAYLGIQNISVYASNKENCDYELYSNSTSYQIYVYPFSKICVGKDSQTQDLIYEQIYCDLYLLDSQTKQYNFVKRFNSDNSLPNTSCESFKPTSGYYKITYVTESGNPIYALDSNYNFITETDYDGNPVKILDERYTDKILKAKPYEGSGNVYMLYKDKMYRIELAAKGPLEVTLCSTIPNVTFKYLVNNVGQDVVDGKPVPFEGNTVKLDKSSVFTIMVWVVENGVESDFINFYVDVNVPRKVTIWQWLTLIAGAIIILGGSTYLMYRKNKNETNTDIDFEI